MRRHLPWPGYTAAAGRPSLGRPPEFMRRPGAMRTVRQRVARHPLYLRPIGAYRGRRMTVVCHVADHVSKSPPRRVIAPLDHASFTAWARRTGNDAVRPIRVFS